MRIWINQCYIDKGDCGKPGSCAVALKLQALTKKRVGVGAMTAGIGHEFFRLGESARMFIRKFDANKQVKPQYVTIKDLQVSDLE